MREAAEWLLTRLPAAARMSFRRLIEDAPTRLDAIVRFLAVLELYKHGLVELDQAGTFGEIEISWIGPDEGAAELALAGVDAYEG